MNKFYYGLDALSAGDLQLSRDFFSLLGGRDKEERRNDSKFSLSIGYASKELILSGCCTDNQIKILKEQLAGSGTVGYASLIEGISKRDTLLVENGIQKILEGHKIQIRAGNMFSLQPDRWVSFWGMGLINLAKYYGMSFNVPDSDILPKSLIYVSNNNLA